MFHDLILPDTRPCEWAEIRARIRARILDSFGTAPIPVKPTRTPFEITDEYVRFGLKHLMVRYHVLDDIWNEAIIVLPEDISEYNRWRADALCAVEAAAPWSIIAITFTNKAANELKERLTNML